MESKVPSFVFMERVALVYVSLAFGPESCSNTVNATVVGHASHSTALDFHIPSKMLRTRGGGGHVSFSRLSVDEGVFPSIT